MKNLFATLCILLLSVSALAQQGGLRPYSGRVVDEVTGEPLPFVNVYAGEGRGAVTNLQGDFTLSAHETMFCGSRLSVMPHRLSLHADCLLL